MAISTYDIYELLDPNDGRCWRMHWFQELTLNQQTRQPLIEATFVPLVYDYRDIGANPGALLKNDSYDFSQSKTINLGAGILPMLHIGMLLPPGEPPIRPGYQRKIFDVSISEDTTDVLPIVSGRWSADRRRRVYDVPFSQYQLNGTNSFVRCLHIRVPPGRSDKISKVIIPATELIRFYYANSSELIQQVVTDGLAGSPNRVFDPARTILPGSGTAGIPFVFLAPNVTREDAPIIALFAFSPYAFRRAKQIYLSAQVNGTRRTNTKGGRPQGFLPEVCLPYIDSQTRLIVHGKEIRSGTERFFLVYWIASDSVTFPFESFEFARDRSAPIIPSNRVGTSGSDADDKGRVVTVQNCPTKVIRSDKDPGPNRKRVERLGWESKFPDLRKKKWKERPYKTRPAEPLPIFIKAEGESKPFTTGVEVNPSSTVTSLSVRCGPQNGRSHPSEVEPASGSDELGTEPEAVPASRVLFGKLVEILNAAFPGKMRCDPLQIPESGDEKRFGQLYTLFPAECGNERLKWSFVSYKGGRRTRRVEIARGVCHEKQYFYLFEIESVWRRSRKGRTYTLLLAHSHAATDMNVEKLRELLRCCAGNKGSWFKPDEVAGIARHKFKHPAHFEKNSSRFEKNFAARILEYLVNARMLRLEAAEQDMIVRLRSDDDSIVDPNVALHTEGFSEVSSYPPKSNELKKTIPELNDISTGVRTKIQQSLNFD